MKKLFTLFCAVALAIGVNVAQTAPQAFSAKKAPISVEQVQKVQLEQAKPAVRASFENAQRLNLNQFSAAPALKVTNQKAQAPAVKANSKSVKANIQQASAQPALHKAPATVNEVINVTDGELYQEPDYIEIWSEAQQLYFIYYFNAAYELNRAYTDATPADMYVVCTLTEDYEQEDATAYSITITKEDELLHIDATMTTESGAEYAITYQEQPFVPTGVQINVNATNYKAQYVSYYGEYVYTATNDDFYISLWVYTDTETGTFTEDVDIEGSYLQEAGGGDYVLFHSVATPIVVANEAGNKSLTGSLYAENGDEYIFNLTYEKPDAKEIFVNVAEADLNTRTLTAGVWTIGGTTADKNNSVNIYFISKALQGTFTDVEQFDAYSTWVSDKSTGKNVYYENLSAVNLTSAIDGDSLKITGTLNLSDSDGNPAIVTVYITTPFAQSWGEWTDFTPFDVNTGKYALNAVFGGAVVTNVPVKERKDNTGLKQYQFLGVGKGGYYGQTGIDMTLNMNPDYTFTVKPVGATVRTSSGSMNIILTDAYTATQAPQYAAESYYDPETGIFTIFTVALNSTATEVLTADYETMTMDQPIVERDTVKVTTDMKIFAEPAKGIIKVSAELEETTYILEVVGTDTIGTFSLKDGTLSQDYYYGIVSAAGRLDFTEGEVTIAKNDTGLKLNGLMIGENEKAYVFDWTYTPITERDTVKVNLRSITVEEDLNSTTRAHRGWLYEGQDTDTLYIVQVLGQEKLGTFSYADGTLGMNYYNVIPSSGGERIQFTEGEVTIDEDEDGVKLTGLLIGEDEKAYVFNWIQPAGVLQYDTDAPFDATFAWSDMNATIEDGVIGIYATNADMQTIGLELYTDPANTTIPEGTFVISDSYEAGTALKSVGVEGGYLIECWAGIRGTSGSIERCWFMVEGTIALSYDEYGKLKVEVDAKNSYNQPVTALVQYEKIEPKDTVVVEATNLDYIDTEDGMYSYFASNSKYGVLLTVHSETPDGNFDGKDIDFSRSAVIDAKDNMIRLQEGEFAVAVEGKNLTLTGSVISSDAVLYQLSFTGYQGAIEGDAQEDFITSFSTEDIQTVTSKSATMITVTNEDGEKATLVFMATELTARTYEINSSKSKNTVLASDSETLQGTSYTTRATEDGDQVWHMVSGTVTINENGEFTVEALNSYDKAINFTIANPVSDFYLQNYSNELYLGWNGKSTDSNKIDMMEEADRMAVDLTLTDAEKKQFTVSVTATDDKPMYLSLGTGFNFKTYADGGEQGHGYLYEIEDINKSQLVANKVSEAKEGCFYLIVYGYNGSYSAIGGTVTDTDGKGKMRILGYTLKSADDQLTIAFSDIQDYIYRYVTATTPAPAPRPTEEPVVEGNILDEESYNFNGGTVGKWLSAGSKPAVLSAVAPGYNNSAYALKVTTATGGNNYDTQVKYVGQYIKGHTYTYSFKAKASKNVNMQVALQQDGGQYLGDYSMNLALTTEWQEYSGEITVSNDGYVRFLLNVGETAADYFFDQIVLIDKTATTIAPVFMNGNDVIFTVGGQRVLEPLKGQIYIINGQQTLFE